MCTTAALLLINARLQLYCKSRFSAVGTEKCLSPYFPKNTCFLLFTKRHLFKYRLHFFPHSLSSRKVMKSHQETTPLLVYYCMITNTCRHYRVVCPCLPSLPIVRHRISAWVSLLLLAHPGPKSSSGLAIRGLILGKMSLLHPFPFYFFLYKSMLVDALIGSSSSIFLHFLCISMLVDALIGSSSSFSLRPKHHYRLISNALKSLNLILIFHNFGFVS